VEHDVVLRLSSGENFLGGLLSGEGSETVLAGLVLLRVSGDFDRFDVSL